MEKAKEVLGESIYKEVLGREGYLDAADVPPEHQGVVLNAMREEAKAQ
jgi:hypothetical protein